jgi:hypothetical protein
MARKIWPGEIVGVRVLVALFCRVAGRWFAPRDHFNLPCRGLEAVSTVSLTARGGTAESQRFRSGTRRKSKRFLAEAQSSQRKKSCYDRYFQPLFAAYLLALSSSAGSAPLREIPPEVRGGSGDPLCRRSFVVEAAVASPMREHNVLCLEKLWRLVESVANEPQAGSAE